MPSVASSQIARDSRKVADIRKFLWQSGAERTAAPTPLPRFGGSFTRLQRKGSDFWCAFERGEVTVIDDESANWLGPISGSHQGQQPQRLHSKAGYMAAPERFANTSDFLLHRGRRPYMAHRDERVRLEFSVAIGGAADMDG